MTKEETTYAGALNVFGSDLPVMPRDGEVKHSLRRLRQRADDSVGIVRCPFCREGEGRAYQTGGEDDGEQFAELWDHLIKRHHSGLLSASTIARDTWGLPAYTDSEVQAA